MLLQGPVRLKCINSFQRLFSGAACHYHLPTRSSHPWIRTYSFSPRPSASLQSGEASNNCEYWSRCTSTPPAPRDYVAKQSREWSSLWGNQFASSTKTLWIINGNVELLIRKQFTDSFPQVPTSLQLLLHEYILACPRSNRSQVGWSPFAVISFCGYANFYCVVGVGRNQSLNNLVMLVWVCILINWYNYN